MSPQVATQALEFNDFSGGETDHYIDCPLNRGQKFENVHILPNKKLKIRWGSDLDDDSANAQIPAGNQRIGALLNYNNSDMLLVQSAKKIYYRNTSAYTTLVGPVDSNDVFNEGSTSSYVSHSEWNRHLFVTNDLFPKLSKIYKDSGGTLRVRTAGLPALATSPAVAAGIAGTRSYVYGFHYFFTYTIGTEVFEDKGPVTEVQLSSSGDPSVNANLITAIPVLANGATTNYDTVNIKVHIFRTIDSGSEKFKIGEVTNGTTTFNDHFSDSTAEDGESIYTTGGVLDNNPPPLCKFLHIVNNTSYFCHLSENGEVSPNSYGTSIAADPDSSPLQFRDTVEDEIAGVNSAQSIPIILCKRHIYRSEGAFDELGRGSLTHIRISDTAGCISNRSCVQAEGNLFWAGNDGFYVTDGYKVQKISDHRNLAYADYVAAMDNTKAIVGTFDEKYRRILWGIQGDSASADNDTIAVCELRWGIGPEMVFTRMTGGDSFSPTSLVFFDKQLYRADYRGYVFVHDELSAIDRKVDLTKSAADWTYQTIIYDYKGPTTSFGTTLGRKWVPNCMITLGNEGNVSVQPNAINDDGRAIRVIKPIRYRDSFTWGDPNFVWNNLTCVWGVAGIVEQWRRMPARGLRLSYFQLELTNANSIITNSDFLGQGTVDASALTVTLPTLEWPDYSIDYFISFENDDYAEQYPVTAQSGTQITFSDVNGLVPASAAYKWVLRGYPKAEVFSLLSYGIMYSTSSKSQKTFQASDTGENA